MGPPGNIRPRGPALWVPPCWVGVVGLTGRETPGTNPNQEHTMDCPICGVVRPTEMHLDWCTYDGPEPDEGDEGG